MGNLGYEGTELGATTGAETLVLDGIPIEEPEDVRAQIDYFVKNHGDTALALGFSSSMTLGVPHENLDAARERFLYWRSHIE